MMSLRTLIVGGLLLGALFLLYVPDWDLTPTKGQEIGFPQEIQFENVARERWGG